MRRAVCFDLMDTVLRDPYKEALTAATGLCIGASVDAMVDGRVSGARVDDPAARGVASWFVSLGVGAR